MLVLYKILVFIHSHIPRYNTYVKYVHGAHKCFGSKTPLHKTKRLSIIINNNILISIQFKQYDTNIVIHSDLTKNYFST